MRLAGVALLLLSGVTLSGQRPYTVDLPPPPPPPKETLPAHRTGTGAIRGRVIRKDSDDPLRHARIDIRSQDGAFPSVLSDGDGRFAVSALPPGRYTVAASKPGYVKTSSAVTLSASAPIGEVDFALTRGGIISGTIVDEFGNPAPDLSVVIERVEKATPTPRTRVVAIAQSDDTGAYRATGLPPDVYLVDTTPGLQLVPDPDALRPPTESYGPIRGPKVFYPGAETIEAAQRITVQGGDEKGGVSFIVPAASMPGPQMSSNEGRVPAERTRTNVVVRGRVFAPDGRPLGGARVIVSDPERPRPPASSQTGADGSYELAFDALAAHRHRITAVKAPYVPVSFGQPAGSRSARLLSFQAGETREGIDITLRRLGTLAGRLLDDLGEPVAGVLVQAMDLRYENGRRQLTATNGGRTDDLGRFRIARLRPGRYAISAAPGHIASMMEASADVPGYGRTYYPGTADLSQIQFVTVRGPDDITDIDFVLARANTFRVGGYAYDVDGSPVTGGIALVPSARAGGAVALQLGARIDRDGAFTFTDVTPGEYVLQVVRGRSQRWSEGHTASRYVTVTDHDVGDLMIETRAGSSITGRVTLVNGQPPPADIRNLVEIVAQPVDPDASPRIGGPPARARVDADGRFELAGIAGPRRLQVVRALPGWMERAVLVEGIDVTDQPLPFGRDDQSLADVEIQLTDQVTTIRGRLLDARDVPLNDLTVLAFSARRELWYPGSRSYRRIFSLPAEEFAIEGLPADEYYVVALEIPPDPGELQDPDVLERLSRGAARVHLADGQTTSVTVRLTK